MRRDVVMPGPFIMQCLLGCAGVSPAQHNYWLFWCVVLGTAVFPLRSVVFCWIFLCSSSLVFPFARLLLSSAPLCVCLFSDASHLSVLLLPFLNLLLKLSLKQGFELNISISCTFVVVVVIVGLSCLIWSLQISL